MTLAAQILTLPLIVFYFGRLSVVGLLANLLILPAQPPIMVGGMITLIVGLIWELLGQIAAVVPWFFLTYTTAVVRRWPRCRSHRWIRARSVARHRALFRRPADRADRPRPAAFAQLLPRRGGP